MSLRLVLALAIIVLAAYLMHASGVGQTCGFTKAQVAQCKPLTPAKDKK